MKIKNYYIYYKNVLKSVVSVVPPGGYSKYQVVSTYHQNKYNYYHYQITNIINIFIYK